MDPDEFNQLVADYAPILLRKLTRFLRDRHFAEDVLQEVWLKAYNHYDSTREAGPWLSRVARNAAIDLCRRQGKRAKGLTDEPLGVEPDPLDALEAKELQEWTRRAVESLPGRLRDTARLVALEGKTCREAAEALDVPLSTVKSRMSIAIPTALRRYGSK